MGSQRQPGWAWFRIAWTSGSRKFRTRGRPLRRASTSRARAAHTEHPLSKGRYRFGMASPPREGFPFSSYPLRPRRASSFLEEPRFDAILRE
jgi:hypothetical protein